jgi:hypothetical protein
MVLSHQRENTNITLEDQGYDVLVSTSRLMEIFADEVLDMQQDARLTIHHNSYNRVIAFLKIWCAEQTRGKWSVLPYTAARDTEFRFSRRDDAMLFKLTWGGQ